jgi:glycerol-3-phosphate O-acyltransferase/dihydroxyacetone phosphate acyltransferase
LRKFIQAARRLYNPKGKKLPLPMVVELNRRLVKGYTTYQDNPRIVKIKKSVMEYNKQLRHLGVRDHQVEYAKFSILKVVSTLIYRLAKLAVMAVGTLPGLVLFAPVFVATKIISTKKSREALAASTVKLQGRDVMATWKLLVALAFAPLLYAFYTVLLAYWTYHNRVQRYVPEWVPPWLVVLFGIFFFLSITFAALRTGEVGMDIVKSLRPLILSLNPTSANTLVKLRDRRVQLSHEVTELINTLGPEMFPDFDATRIIADPFRDPSYIYPTSVTRWDHVDVESLSPTEPRRIGEFPSSQGHLPRNESFHDLANIGFFSTRPPSRSRSRSSSSGGLAGSGGLPLRAFSSLDSKESFAEVSKRIRGAMKERGQERRRRSEDGSWDMASSGSQTPYSQEDKKDL